MERRNLGGMSVRVGSCKEFDRRILRLLIELGVVRRM